MSQSPYRTSSRRTERSDVQMLESFGVLGWIMFMFFAIYMVLSSLLSKAEDDLNKKLDPASDHPIEMVGWLTGPGDFIRAHTTALAVIAIVIAIIALFRLLAKTFRF